MIRISGFYGFNKNEPSILNNLARQYRIY